MSVLGHIADTPEGLAGRVLSWQPQSANPSRTAGRLPVATAQRMGVEADDPVVEGHDDPRP